VGQETELTAEYILKNRRAHYTSELSGEEAASIPAPTPKEIRKSLAVQFARGCDAGLWNRLTGPVLEPPNPFDATQPRRLRQEAAVVGSLILIFLVLAACFNFLPR